MADAEPMMTPPEQPAEPDAMAWAALDAVPDLVATLDLDGRLLHLNRAGRAMCGLRDGEPLRGRFLDEFFRPADSRKINAIFSG